MMRLRTVLVGCGKVADLHVVEIKKLSTAHLVAVCDVEPLMAAQLAVRHGIPASYSDFDRMLEAERPDVVHITTPPASHLPLAMRAIDAGCHLFIEKPATLSHGETARLIAYAEMGGSKLTVGYTYYFDPVMNTLRRLVADNVIGDTVHVESFLGYNLTGAFGMCVVADPNHWVRKLPGKLFHNVLDHLLNQITEFMPDDNYRIHACSWQRKQRSDQRDTELPDELRIMLLGDNKSAYATFSSHARPLQHFFTLYGTKNSAHLDFTNGTITLSSHSVLPGALGRLSCTFDEGWQYICEGGRNVLRFGRSRYHALAGFTELMTEFYSSVLHDAPVPISYDQILQVSSVTDEVCRQLSASECERIRQ